MEFTSVKLSTGTWRLASHPVSFFRLKHFPCLVRIQSKDVAQSMPTKKHISNSVMLGLTICRFVLSHATQKQIITFSKNSLISCVLGGLHCRLRHFWPVRLSKICSVRNYAPSTNFTPCGCRGLAAWPR